MSINSYTNHFCKFVAFSVCRHPYFFVIGIAANRHTDLFDVRRGVDNFDHHVRVGTEALIVHTWYSDFWDVRPDDPDNWNAAMFRKLVAVLIRDRKVPRQEFETESNYTTEVSKPYSNLSNRTLTSVIIYLQVWRDMISRVLPYLSFVPGSLNQEIVPQTNVDETQCQEVLEIGLV